MAILLVLLLLPLSAAQNPAAPHPDPVHTTLWAHTTSDESALFMNALEGDTQGAYLHPGTGASSVSAGADDDFLFELPLAPGLVGDLELDAAGEIYMKAYIGGGAFTVGRISATASLWSGDTLIGQGDTVTNNLQPGDTNEGETYNVFEWTFAPEITTVPAGADLVWKVEGSGSWNNLYFSANDNRGRSLMTLPIVGVSNLPTGTPAASYQNLTSDIIELEWAWNATSESNIYNWTGPAGDLAIVFTSNVTAGNVSLLVHGPEGELVNRTFQGLDASALNVTVPAGNWTLRVDAMDATGAMRLEIRPVPADDPGPGDVPQDDDDAPTDAPDDDGTGEGEDSPAAPLALLLVGLALVALRRRR